MGNMAELAVVAEVFIGCQVVVSDRCFDDRSDPFEALRPFLIVLRAKKGDIATACFQELGNDLDQSGLTGSVLANQTVNISFFYRQTHIGQSVLPAEFFADLL